MSTFQRMSSEVSSSRLLRLPTELRLLIFEHIYWEFPLIRQQQGYYYAIYDPIAGVSAHCGPRLALDRLLIEIPRKMRNREVIYSAVHPQIVSLLNVCKTLRLEVLGVMERTSVFAFEPRSICRSVNQRFRHVIRHMIVDVGKLCNFEYHFDLDWFPVLRDMIVNMRLDGPGNSACFISAMLSAYSHHVQDQSNMGRDRFTMIHEACDAVESHIWKENCADPAYESLKSSRRLLLPLDRIYQGFPEDPRGLPRGLRLIIEIIRLETRSLNGSQPNFRVNSATRCNLFFCSMLRVLQQASTQRRRMMAQEPKLSQSYLVSDLIARLEVVGGSPPDLESESRSVINNGSLLIGGVSTRRVMRPICKTVVRWEEANRARAYKKQQRKFFSWKAPVSDWRFPDWLRMPLEKVHQLGLEDWQAW